MRARMSATDVMTAPLANSEGWNLNTPNSIHRAASFVEPPKNEVTKSRMQQTGRKKIGITLKKRHGILCTPTTTSVPRARKQACFINGDQKLPDLYDRVLGH